MTDILPISFGIALVIIFFEKTFKSFFGRNLRKSPQTLHNKSVSRFGGLAVFFSLIIVVFIDEDQHYSFLKTALFCSMPIFILGIFDDFNIRIKPIYRLLLALPSAYLAYYYLGIQAYGLDLPYIDEIFKIDLFAIIFICLALAGIINAFNMLDGINGLVLLYVMAICVTNVLFSSNRFDPSINLASVALFFSCLGIFILNFPFGRIFLGDGGAYFLGLVVACIVIKNYQINALSPWYVFCIFIYPITDTLVTVARRMYTNISALEPDNRHLHHLIYKKISKTFIRSEKKKHALTTIAVFILYTPFLILANFFAAQTYVLMSVSFVFIMFYLLLYILLTPKDFS